MFSYWLLSTISYFYAGTNLIPVTYAPAILQHWVFLRRHLTYTGYLCTGHPVISAPAILQHWVFLRHAIFVPVVIQHQFFSRRDLINGSYHRAGLCLAPATFGLTHVKHRLFPQALILARPKPCHLIWRFRFSHSNLTRRFKSMLFTIVINSTSSKFAILKPFTYIIQIRCWMPRLGRRAEFLSLRSFVLRNYFPTCSAHVYCIVF